MKKLLTLATVLAFAVFAFGCGGGGEESAKADKPMATKTAGSTGSGSYVAMDVADGGTIKGTVTFAGAAPAKQKLEVTKDVNVCGKVAHYKEDIIVGSNNGLANVVVKIANISKGKAMDTGTFELDQNGCAFVPHITVVPAGAECTILNSDKILHNIHTYSEKNAPMNIAQPGFKKRMKQTFKEPETIRVACDVHNWMAGYIVVTEHPYYAVTDANGNFELSGVPAGSYTLEYWQEKLGKQTTQVTVAAGGMAEANLEYTVGSN